MSDLTTDTNEPDVVWLRATAEVGLAGVEATVVYQAWHRPEWDAMSADGRQAAIDELAGYALDQAHVEYGADVIDGDEIAEIPAADRADALADLPELEQIAATGQ